MRYGLAWVGVLGGLSMVGRAEGRPPALDKGPQAGGRKLQGKRRAILGAALESREKLYQSGRAELDGVIETSKRLMAAEVDLAATGAERIAAHERQYEKAQALIEIAKARHQAARGTEIGVLDARAFSLEA